MQVTLQSKIEYTLSVFHLKSCRGTLHDISISRYGQNSRTAQDQSQRTTLLNTINCPRYHVFTCTYTWVEISNKQLSSNQWRHNSA